MLRINQVKVSFGDKEVLKEVTFEINTGEIFGILGKNGAGKTTLFNSLFNRVDFTGEILLNEDKIQTNQVAFLESDNYFYPYMKAKEYLDFFGFSTNKKYLTKLAEVFDIPLDAYVDSFSTGMKKKLALLGVTSLSKPVLILDEPFNGLDMESVEKLYLYLEELKRHGKTILVSSHIIETLTNTCNRIGYLNRGRLDKIYSKDTFDIIENDIRNEIGKDWQKAIRLG